MGWEVIGRIENDLEAATLEGLYSYKDGDSFKAV